MTINFCSLATKTMYRLIISLSVHFLKNFSEKSSKCVFFFVVFSGKLVNGQKLFVSIKTEMSCVVICKIIGIGAVAHDKQLHKAKQWVGVAVSSVAFVVHNLLHGFTWADLQTFQFDLHNRNAVYQQNHIITMMAVAFVDAQLMDDFKFIFALVFDVYQSVMQRCSVLTDKCVYFPQSLWG